MRKSVEFIYTEENSLDVMFTEKKELSRIFQTSIKFLVARTERECML